MEIFPAFQDKLSVLMLDVEHLGALPELSDAVAAGTWQWLHASAGIWTRGAEARQLGDQLFQLARRQGLYLSLDLNVDGLGPKKNGTEGVHVREPLPHGPERQRDREDTPWLTLYRTVLPLLTWVLIRRRCAMKWFGTVEETVIDAALRSAGFQGIGVVVLSDHEADLANWMETKLRAPGDP